MWADLIVEILFMVTILYLPGIAVMYSIGYKDEVSVCAAPLISSFLIYIWGMVLAMMGASTTWFGVICPVVLVSLASAAIRYLLEDKNIANLQLRFPATGILHAVVISFLVVIVCYIVPLDGANSFAQMYDNYNHLSVIRDFLATGSFAKTDVLAYPTMWHSLSALAASFWLGDVCLAANAVNVVLMGVVLPLSVRCFLLSLFPENRSVADLSALVACSFAAFPWGMVTFGPLYPLLVGNTMLLLAGSFFVRMLDSSCLESPVCNAIVFVLGCFVLLVSHPSSIFLGIVLLSPYAAFRLHEYLFSKGFSRAVSLLLSICFVVFVAFFWFACFSSAAFRSVVSFNWPAKASRSEAFSNLALFDIAPAGAPQPALSFLVLVGIAMCYSSGRNVWLIVPFAISSLFYFVNVTSEGFLKHLLTGFWYTDPYRISAMVSICAIPLASLGLSGVIAIASDLLLGFTGEGGDRSRAARRLESIIAAVFVLIVYFPSFSVPNNVEFVTAFGSVRSSLTEANSLAENYRALDSSEIKFANEVSDIVGESKILNYPYDGSLYTYALCGLNVFERSWYSYQFDTNEGHRLIRESLSRVAEDIGVQTALRDEGIEYLMLLDCYSMDYVEGEMPAGMYRVDYIPGAWSGIESVVDGTPGFELILSEGDMRLYRINAQYGSE